MEVTFKIKKDSDPKEIVAEFAMNVEQVHVSIIEQAHMMEMKIVNNRKRMRKRVRQRRKYWAPPHWTENPGDW